MKESSHLSHVAQLGEELFFVHVAVFVEVRLLDELHNVCVCDVDVQVLVEHVLDLAQLHQPSLLAVEQGEHLLSLGFSPLAVKPLPRYHLQSLAQRELLLAAVIVSYSLLDLLAVHLREGEVPENASEIVAGDAASFVHIVERKCVLDLVLLSCYYNTMSSESLLGWTTFACPSPRFLGSIFDISYK